MNIDLSKYKVIYNERVLRALAIVEIYTMEKKGIVKLKKFTSRNLLELW